MEKRKKKPKMKLSLSFVCSHAFHFGSLPNHIQIKGLSLTDVSFSSAVIEAHTLIIWHNTFDRPSPHTYISLLPQALMNSSSSGLAVGKRVRKGDLVRVKGRADGWSWIDAEVTLVVGNKKEGRIKYLVVSCYHGARSVRKLIAFDTCGRLWLRDTKEARKQRLREQERQRERELLALEEMKIFMRTQKDAVAQCRQMFESRARGNESSGGGGGGSARNASKVEDEKKKKKKKQVYHPVASLLEIL